MLIGGAVGIAVARVPILRAAIGSIITGLQTMPSVAWVPLAIILFHEGQGTVTFVVVLGAAPSIANGIINGIDHVPPVLLRAGRVLGARGFGALRHVVIPAALPAVIGGLKQGWAFAWRSLMAAELIGALGGHLGIGQLLNGAQVQADYVGVFEAMIVILIIGILDRLAGVRHRSTARSGAATASSTPPRPERPLPAVALFDLDLAHLVADLGLVGDVEALDHVAEQVVALGELALAVVDADEELRTVRVGAGVGHRDRAVACTRPSRARRRTCSRDRRGRNPRGSRPGSRTRARRGGT